MSSPIRTGRGPVLLILGAIAIGPPRIEAGDAALTIADLAAYQAALKDRKEGEPPAVAVGFRELWDYPDAYQGKRVEVRGRVVRRFRQGAFGTFPPLAEVWVVAPSSDPFCLVYPEPGGRPDAGPAGTVRFVGTFLKQVRYEGGDGPRLGPLIVGPRPPVALESAPVQAPASKPSIPWLDWTIGLLAAGVVVVVLTAQHLKRPVPRVSPPEIGPPPLFEDSP